MMQYFTEGIKVGFVLIFLIGPIFFSLIHMGVEYGTRAGLIFGSGIWISDIFLFFGIYHSVSLVSDLANDSLFTHAIGAIGSLILLSFGLGALFRRGSHEMHVPQAFQPANSPRSLFGFFLKGALINVFNPFTLLFWLGLMSTALVDSHFRGGDAAWYFLGIMSVYIPVDVLKIMLSKEIRNRLKPHHIKTLSRILGVVLMVFGLVLFLRVFVLD